MLSTLPAKLSWAEVLEEESSYDGDNISDPNAIACSIQPLFNDNYQDIFHSRKTYRLHLSCKDSHETIDDLIISTNRLFPNVAITVRRWEALSQAGGLRIKKETIVLSEPLFPLNSVTSYCLGLFWAGRNKRLSWIVDQWSRYKEKYPHFEQMDPITKYGFINALSCLLQSRQIPDHSKVIISRDVLKLDIEEALIGGLCLYLNNYYWSDRLDDESIKASILMAKAIASECIGDLEVAFYIYADALSMAVKRIISSGATSFEHYNKSKLVTPPLDISRNYALARLMHVYTTLELRNSEFDQEVSGLINTSEYFRNYIATKTYYRFNASNLPEYTSISTKDYAFLGECDLYLNLVTDSPLFLSEFSSVHMSLRFWQDGSIYDTYIRNQSDILHQLRSSFSAFFELGSETNVEDFNTNHYESARQLFDELYDIIPKHISNIYLSADRYLTSIPWQLQFLQKFSHRSHLTCLHSISKPSLELAIGKDKGEYKFILSNFHIDNSVKRYLDHKIHDLGTVFDNTNSNKESFLRNLGSSDLFVFIGHGGLKIDNREMKLQLPDQSIIDFKEIKTITSIDPKKLRVAILFSCFSGFSLPSNEDYDENDLGLPTLFKSLGYDFVIATAWPIDLSIACDFVSHFSSLIHSGHSVREAYSIAYNQLYEDYEFSDFLVRGSCIQLYA